jgi:predicted enzyme involved in methoxymalonyl-ACP biosynthesis
LIGFAIVRQTDATVDIEDFMLSCRVQGRFIEKAFFAHLERHHNSGGARLIRVRFTETSRNQPAKQSLEAAQFTIGADGLYSRDTGTEGWGEADMISVTCSAPCHERLAASQCTHSE